jgi:hypothetical protein
MSHVRQELLTLPEHMSSPTLFSGVRVFCVMLCIHHRLSFFFLAIVLSVLLQFTDSDYPLISSNFSYLSSTSTDCLHSRNGLLYCVHKICLFSYLCLILETDIFFCVLFFVLYEVILKLCNLQIHNVFKFSNKFIQGFKLSPLHHYLYNKKIKRQR